VSKKPLEPGTRMQAEYRVHPFLIDDVFIVEKDDGKGRVLVRTVREIDGKPISGWMDRTNLKPAHVESAYPKYNWPRHK
jgi:hypothetical protein